VVGSAGQLQAATYVVDQAAAGAADTNPGSEEKPFKTIQHAADVAKAGDTVFVMAGKYDERVVVKTSGAEGQMISLRAMPRRSAIVQGFDLDGSFVRVEGFEITADKAAAAFQLRSSNCEVVDNYVHDMFYGVNSGGGRGSKVSHNRIAYNRVYHSEFGFVMSGEDWLVENNEVERLFMYAPGNKNDDCDYSRFFGKGCVQRYNYYHGSKPAEIKVAHVDCLQTFPGKGGSSVDLLFEYNTCFDFHQMCMVEKLDPAANLCNWTFRGNIASTNGALHGGWGPDIIHDANVTIENNTIWSVNWACIGLRDPSASGGQIRNNILGEADRAVIDSDSSYKTPSKPVIEYNLAFIKSKDFPLAGETNLNGKDPLFVDAAKRDFRLKKGSPAIGAGKGGVTIGAMEYPNVYYVDPRHPAAADEPGWGYPGVPLATLAKAGAVAETGETIVLRGGVYREVLAPKNNGVTVRAMKGEKVAISGADLIEGWKREADGSWSAPLAAEPKKILRDGKPWSEFTYDKAAKRVALKAGGDPRLRVFETVVREHGIDTTGRQGVKIEGIDVVDTLGAPTAGGAK
jgi:hypothetical protein